jgi:hypothetical protein
MLTSEVPTIVGRDLANRLILSSIASIKPDSFAGQLSSTWYQIRNVSATMLEITLAAGRLTDPTNHASAHDGAETSQYCTVRLQKARRLLVYCDMYQSSLVEALVPGVIFEQGISLGS